MKDYEDDLEDYDPSNFESCLGCECEQCNDLECYLYGKFQNQSASNYIDSWSDFVKANQTHDHNNSSLCNCYYCKYKYPR